ncbi:hypothetical protein EH30_06520 [Erythrobacter sp. JL475]|nr:hypothetical protein EH30_06520 [Erythrobacter sp. JL475]
MSAYTAQTHIKLTRNCFCGPSSGLNNLPISLQVVLLIRDTTVDLEIKSAPISADQMTKPVRRCSRRGDFQFGWENIRCQNLLWLSFAPA